MEHVNALTVVLGSLAVVMAVMSVAFLLALKFKFFSLVDVVWAYLFTLVVGMYSLISDGWAPRRVILLGMVTFWSVRLGTHLLMRLKAHFPSEDARYDDLRAKWALTLNLNFFIFFLFQGLSVLILAVPFLLVALDPTPHFSAIAISGGLLWLVGVIGETVADMQLRRFKSSEQNRGLICDTGLWQYCRHPNYFCEWLIWVGYFLFAFSSPNGWVALVSPLLMLYLLLKVSGVPYAEATALKINGDGYRAYQARVSRFFPRPKKK